MKASELMVGDLVRVTEDVCIKKGTIVEIVGVDATRTLPKHGLVGCTLCTPLNHDDNLYGGYGGVWTAFLEPIPITKPILKKNGFELNDSFAFLDTAKYRIYVFYDGFITIVDDDNQRKVSYLECDCVHQLQHAMRLCGIDTRFKI